MKTFKLMHSNCTCQKYVILIRFGFTLWVFAYFLLQHPALLLAFLCSCNATNPASIPLQQLPTLFPTFQKAVQAPSQRCVKPTRLSYTFLGSLQDPSLWSTFHSIPSAVLCFMEILTHEKIPAAEPSQGEAFSTTASLRNCSGLKLKKPLNNRSHLQTDS